MNNEALPPTWETHPHPPPQAQHRYFSHHAMLVAMVSQKCFVLALLDIAPLLRDTLQNEVSHRCACVSLSTEGGGGIAPFWGSANLSLEVLRDMGEP